jgi:hypothetical protein
VFLYIARLRTIYGRASKANRRTTLCSLSECVQGIQRICLHARHKEDGGRSNDREEPKCYSIAKSESYPVLTDAHGFELVGFCSDPDRII